MVVGYRLVERLLRQIESNVEMLEAVQDEPQTGPPILSRFGP